MMSDNVFAKALLGDTYCKEMLYLSDDKEDPGRITFIEPDKLKRYGYFFRCLCEGFPFGEFCV